MRRRVVLTNDRGMVIGEDHPRAKVRNADVDEAVAMHEAGVGYGRIAWWFGVSKGTVRDWVRGRRRAQTATGQRVVGCAYRGRDGRCCGP